MSIRLSDSEMVEILEAAKEQLGLHAFNETARDAGIKQFEHLEPNQFETLLNWLRSRGPKKQKFQIPLWLAKRLSRENREPLILELQQLFSAVGLPWSDADNHAKCLYGVPAVRWCDYLQMQSMVDSFTRIAREIKK